MCVCVYIILAVSSNASVVSANGSGDNQQRQNPIVRVRISIIVISSSMYSTMKAILGKLYVHAISAIYTNMQTMNTILTAACMGIDARKHSFIQVL